MTLDEIDMARVHLSLPESSLFKREQARPKASVALFVRDGQPLLPETVRGIQRLVAASVQEMRPADVTVIDQRGAPATGKDNDIDDPQFALKQAVESYYQRKVMAQLASMTGMAHATVSVDADINFDQVRTTRETDSAYPSDNGKTSSALSGLTALNKSAGKNELPPLPPSLAMSPSATETHRTLEQITTAPGSIRRLTVGVALDRPLSEGESKKMQTMIGASIGLDSARGDVISIFVSQPSPIEPEAVARAYAADAAAPQAASPAEQSEGVIPVAAPDGSPADARLPLDPTMVLVGSLLLLVIGLGLVIRWLRPSRVATRRLAESERHALSVRLQKLLTETEDTHALP
jgi:flagellar M-ring protein FliF